MITKRRAKNAVILAMVQPPRAKGKMRSSRRAEVSKARAKKAMLAIFKDVGRSKRRKVKTGLVEWQRR